METNLYHLTAEQRRERGVVSLPETLGEAIDELSRSELARKALGPPIFDRYGEVKRGEWDEDRVQLTTWGLEKYFSVLGGSVRIRDRSRVLCGRGIQLTADCELRDLSAARGRSRGGFRGSGGWLRGRLEGRRRDWPGRPRRSCRPGQGAGGGRGSRSSPRERPGH